MLDHEPFSRQAPVFKADPGEGVGVEENSEVVRRALVQVIEELKANDNVVAGIFLVFVTQAIIVLVVPDFDGIKPLLEEVFLPLDLPVP